MLRIQTNGSGYPTINIPVGVDDAGMPVSKKVLRVRPRVVGGEVPQADFENVVLTRSMLIQGGDCGYAKLL